jgi:hypothetical protein
MILEPSLAAPQIYEELVKPLQQVEQITLARLILAGLPASFVDDSNTWSDEDLQEWSQSSRQYLEAVLGDD